MASASTDYSTYLRIDDLLGLQQPLTEGAHDEMLFIIVHQVYELWFRLAVWELDAVGAALLAGKPGEAVPLLRRVVVIDELMGAQLRLIETMSPEAFLVFRDPLKPASGFQSTQFREIEFLCGSGAAAHTHASHLTEAQRRRLERRSTEPTLWDALCACMQAHGHDMPYGADDAARERRTVALRALYHDHSAAVDALLHQVCEALLDHDEAIARWRFHHTLMAAREIGARAGTGGSAGVEYLESTVAKRFFPELWSVRSAL